MKVLLLTNIIAPEFSEIIGKKTVVTGGWLHTVVEFLSKQNDIELAVVMPNRNGKEIVSGSNSNITYYFYPERTDKVYQKQTEIYFKAIIDEFNPDIINAFGTEYPRTFSLMNVADCNKVIITMTGIISLYAEHYMGSMPIKYYFPSLRILFRPFINIPTLWEGQKDFINRGKYEVLTMKKAQHIIGRTRFDHAFAYIKSPNAFYYHCNESLRTAFYSSQWNFNECQKYTIILPQAGYPIKGFEVFLEALAILKENYPNIKVIVPGRSSFSVSNLIKRRLLINSSDYDSYIEKKIIEYNLWDNIEFVGLLNVCEMVDRMIKSNIFVLPSAIENSPNTLGEAMILGMPCVASCVGGIQDMILDSIEGYLYPYDEPHIMAYQIHKYFNDPKMAEEMGKRARIRALKTHNVEINMKNLLVIYKKIIEK